MNMTDLDNSIHEILEALSDELNDTGVAAVLRKDEGAPEMVSALLDELGDGDRGIIGDFYFRPIQSKEDPLLIFMSVFTISDAVPKERLTALYEALSYVNFAVPAGRFAIDKDHKFLCYALSTLIPAELDDDQTFRQIDLAVGNAFYFADSFIGVLCDVLDGKMEPDSVIEFLGGPADEE